MSLICLTDKYNCKTKSLREESYIKVNGVGGRNCYKDKMCNISLSPTTSPRPWSSILFVFLSDVKLVLRRCRMKRRHFLRGPSSWCGWTDRALTAVHMCELQSSPSVPTTTTTTTAALPTTSDTCTEKHFTCN